jgi:hypothetical protein
MSRVAVNRGLPRRPAESNDRDLSSCGSCPPNRRAHTQRNDSTQLRFTKRCEEGDYLEFASKVFRSPAPSGIHGVVLYPHESCAIFTDSMPHMVGKGSPCSTRGCDAQRFEPCCGPRMVNTGSVKLTSRSCGVRHDHPLIKYAHEVRQQIRAQATQGTFPDYTIIPFD